MDDLVRPRIDDDADGNVARCELLPKQVHLDLLLGDAALQPERRVACFERHGVGNLAIGPRSPLLIELVALSAIEVIVAEANQSSLEELYDVVSDKRVLVDIFAQLPIPALHDGLSLRCRHRAVCVFVAKERRFVLRVGDVDENNYLINLDSLPENNSRRIEIVR